MLAVRCSQPACRKLLVRRVMAAAPGPSRTSAGANPQRSTNRSMLPPCDTSTRKTTTFAAMRTKVTTAQGRATTHTTSCVRSHRDRCDRIREGELAVRVDVHAHRVAVAELPLEHVHRQRLHQILLDGPLERARAVDGIEPCPGDLSRGLGRQLERHLALGQALAQTTQLDLDDVLDLLQPEGMEDHHLVDAVEQLG